MNDLAQMGRIAFRVEGDWWVSYYALPETMDGAFELGRIRMSIVQDVAAKELFMALMRDAVSAILTDTTGQNPSWPDPLGTPAPEHERAGRA